MPSKRSNWFAAYLLPGIIFQSVLIGGAYATGREIVEYGAKFGAMGAWSILAIFIGFAVMAMIAFEFARVHQTYDYRNVVKQLIGPLWPLFDVLFIVMAIIIIAVVGSASGQVVKDVLGWPYSVGVGFVMVLVGALMAGGRGWIERFKTLGSGVLYGGYILFAGWVLVARGGELDAGFAAANAYAGEASTVGALLFVGILYVGYNLAILPASFFVLDKQTSRKQTLTAGLIAGALATIPFVLTYLAVMTFYPDPAVLEAPVPWLVMLESVGGPVILVLYGFIILWTLIETSTGLIHAMVDRMSVHLQERGRPALKPVHIVLITVGVLGVAAALSQFGIIALVAQGYSAMAYGFLLLFAVPLLTVGVYRLWKKQPNASS